MDRFVVIIPAAGQSTRFGGGRNKLLEEVGGTPILLRTLRAFMGRSDVSGVALATQLPVMQLLQGDHELEERFQSGWLRICAGGDSRAASVRNAMRLLTPDEHWVAVHDAARPLVSRELIDRVFAAAIQHGAAAPAQPMTATVKQAIGPLPARIAQTIPRDSLWAMQTPQAMRREDLNAAFERCPIPLEQVTDDAQLLELAGAAVWLVAGEEANIKVTTPLDLQVAEAIILSAKR